MRCGQYTTKDIIVKPHPTVGIFSGVQRVENYFDYYGCAPLK